MFLGQEVERNVLVCQEKEMRVYYQQAGGVRRGDLEFSFILDTPGNCLEALSLPAEIQQAADAIVGSCVWNECETGPQALSRGAVRQSEGENRMAVPDNLDFLFVICAFLFQIVLIVHFALRKWRFPLALRYGPLVYALGLPAAAVSVLLLLGGKEWSFWLGGFLYLAWAIFGYTVEYLLRIEWRNSRRWAIFASYILLYLATVMFYWWPLALIGKPLWAAYAALFVISTVLNATSHHPAGPPQARATG
jgi:hypothetical protein